MKENKHSRHNETLRVAQVDIGELLRNKRCHLGVTVEQAAEKLKLNAGVIEKLENNQFAEIGSSVYVRGYLSLYARYLGVDTAHIINLYQNQHPADTVAIRPSLDRSMGQRQSKRHSKALSFLLASVTFLGLIYAYAKVEPQFFPAQTAANSTATSEQPSQDNATAAGSVSTAIRAADDAQTLADDVLNDMPLPAASEALATESAANVSAVNATDTAANLAANATDTPPAIQLETANTATTEEPAAPVAKEIHLVMTFKKDCWLKITDANGKVLASNVYSPKRRINVKGTAPFAAVIGRPDTVKSMRINDKTVVLSDYKVGNVKYEIK